MNLKDLRKIWGMIGKFKEQLGELRTSPRGELYPNCDEAEIYEAAMPPELGQLIILPRYTAIMLVCGNTLFTIQVRAYKDFGAPTNSDICLLLATMCDPGVIWCSNYSIELEKYRDPF